MKNFDVSEILGRQVTISYNMFALMDYMESQGFMPKRKYWREYVLESHDISNDTYVEMSFDEGNNEEINKYHAEVRRLMGLRDDQHVTMRISW